MIILRQRVFSSQGHLPVGVGDINLETENGRVRIMNPTPDEQVALAYRWLKGRLNGESREEAAKGAVETYDKILDKKSSLLRKAGKKVVDLAKAAYEKGKEELDKRKTNK